MRPELPQKNNVNTPFSSLATRDPKCELGLSFCSYGAGHCALFLPPSLSCAADVLSCACASSAWRLMMEALS